MDDTKHEKKILQRPILIVIAFAGFLLSIVWVFDIVCGPVIPKTKLARIQNGMSQQSVREILGEPSEVKDAYTWHFTRFGNQGYVTVYFNKRGVVSGVNDESVFP